MAELTLTNISKSFGDTNVLNEISLSLESGELMVLLGPSGCGKTTLLRLIAGLETADNGEIYLGSKRIDALRPKERNVAMVFQNYSLYPHMTVEKNLAFPLKIAGANRDEIWTKTAATADMLGLTDKLKSRPAQLSGGQRQRVALGRAIIREPALFLLDEPLSNLDADLRARMRREIVRIQKELEVTAVYVTHDQAEALTMADRIAVLNEGQLVQVGTPETLYKNPDSLFVAQFIGQPRINVIEARIERHLLLPFGFSLLNAAYPRHVENVLIGLRPEAIQVGAGGEFRATVTSVEYLGSSYVHSLEFKGAAITASVSGKAHEIGREVAFTVSSDDLMLFNPESGERLRPEA